MATLAASPLFAREDRPPESYWISLQYFNLYRIVIAMVFFIASFFEYEPVNFGAHDLRLFRAVCIGYLFLGIGLQFVMRSVRERFNLQLSAHALLDVITIPLLMYASGGMRSGLGVMLLISLTGAGLVAPLRLNFLYAALAVIAVLLEEVYWVLALDLPSASIVPAGLLSMGYFATAGATGWLAQRLAANERLARERGRQLANQMRVNQLVIADMQDGVLVLDRQGRVVEHNPHAMRLLGMDALRGLALAAVLPGLALLGVMAGSVTLVGGPATGLAFAPVFEAAGLPGAAALALTAATFGIVCGGLIGGPVGTRLIRGKGLSGQTRRGDPPDAEAQAAANLAVDNTFVVEVDREDTHLVRNLVWLAGAMLIGSAVSRYIGSYGVTLPGYIGAMLVASVVRNVDDATGWFRIDEQVMEFVGNLALSIFLVVALMDLKLWQLAGQAMPLFVILLVQVAMVAIFALTLSFRIMGRDYDSAVMASGFVGFALGTTANAVANMRALVLRYGPAPRAFLVVPLVGAFFIDFTNAIIITLYVNWLK